MEYNEYVTLVKQVFGTDAGQKLIKSLVNDHAMGNLFGEDDRETYYRVGKRDLVLDLVYVLKLKDLEPFDYLGDL